MIPVRVLVLSFTSRGWHESKLSDALEAQGCVLTRGSLGDVDLNTETATGFIGLGLDAALPDAVFVRGIAAGSFEQITRRLDLLHALEQAGTLVVNAARVIERTVDKGMAAHRLAMAGVATPPSITTESKTRLDAFVRRELDTGRSLVVKPLFGSQGRGLKRVQRIEDVPTATDVEGVWHVQRFVDRDPPWVDWRVLVCESRSVARMTRTSAHWITNRAQGAHCRPSTDDADIVDIAIRASAAVGAWYAGVDVVRDSHGRSQVLEVNGVPAWQGVESVTGVDVAAALARSLVARVRAQTTVPRSIKGV